MKFTKTEYAIKEVITRRNVRYFPVKRKIYFNKIKGTWNYFMTGDDFLSADWKIYFDNEQSARRYINHEKNQKIKTRIIKYIDHV